MRGGYCLFEGTLCGVVLTGNRAPLFCALTYLETRAYLRLISTFRVSGFFVGCADQDRPGFGCAHRCLCLGPRMCLKHLDIHAEIYFV